MSPPAIGRGWRLCRYFCWPPPGATNERHARSGDVQIGNPSGPLWGKGFPAAVVYDVRDPDAASGERILAALGPSAPEPEFLCLPLRANPPQGVGTTR